MFLKSYLFFEIWYIVPFPFNQFLTNIPFKSGNKDFKSGFKEAGVKLGPYKVGSEFENGLAIKIISWILVMSNELSGCQI